MPPLRVLIAPDSFKGSLDAGAVARAMARGLTRAAPDAELRLCPMADGGEGTLARLQSSLGGRRVSLSVHDPLGRPVRGHYGVLDGGRLVVVELAVASGLTRLEPHERAPLMASSFGTGELLRHAIEHHPQTELLLALGGSATVDGGSGLLSALGYRLLDRAGQPIPPGGGGLLALDHIDASQMPQAVRQARLRLLADVRNPLVGPRGAAAVFGPQKGATPAQLTRLDAGLRQLADVLQRQTGRRLHARVGGGAAGGVPVGLLALQGARLQAGGLAVARALGLDRLLQDQRWDFVLTGEGRLDAQSAAGKVVSAVTALAGAQGVPVVALAGEVKGGVDLLRRLGLSAAFSIVDGPMGLSEAYRGAAHLIARQAEQVAQLWTAARSVSGHRSRSPGAGAG